MKIYPVCNNKYNNFRGLWNISEQADKAEYRYYPFGDETKEQIMDSRICATISQILKEGVDGEGGAKNAYVAGYSIAAKTGTSEKKDKYDVSRRVPN